jgi:hypothetical protein
LLSKLYHLYVNHKDVPLKGHFGLDEKAAAMQMVKLGMQKAVTTHSKESVKPIDDNAFLPVSTVHKKLASQMEVLSTINLQGSEGCQISTATNPNCILKIKS